MPSSPNFLMVPRDPGVDPRLRQFVDKVALLFNGLLRTGAIVQTDDASVTLTVSDGDYGDITVSSSGTVWNIDADVVGNTELRNSAAVSVIGRSANSTGDPADIAASANDRLLARTSDTLAFQQLTVGMVPDDLITNAKLRNSAANSVIGRATNTIGDPGDIEATPGFGLGMLVHSGSLLAWAYPTGGTLTGFMIIDDPDDPPVIYAKPLAIGLGGTGSALVDPGGDRILFWDESANAVAFLQVGAGLTITDTTIDATGAGSAPDSASYVVLGTNATLTQERVLTGTANQITITDNGAGATVVLSFPADVIIPTVLTVPNTGLHLLDTNASHDLIVKPGSDLSADRTLTITTGDADRTVTLSGNLTVESASLVNQDLTSDATPTFAGAALETGTTTLGTVEGAIDAGGATSLEIPNGAAPTVNADGEIALDTTVADFSHGLMRIYGGEEQFVISLPVAALASPTDGYVLAYNATNDEFELVEQTGSGGGIPMGKVLKLISMRG